MENEEFYTIFGAQMVNKGAQAMLFVTISEIRKRNPNAKIIVFIYDKWNSEENPSIYNVEFVPINMKQIMNLSDSLLSKIYILIKNARISKKKSEHLRIIDNILKNTKMAFDISGYALSNQWGVNASIFYLSKFYMLHKYNIPIYIMPQSFGPFDYHSKFKNSFMKYYIKKYLRYARLIYSREREGYQLLTDEMGLNNVQLSTDLVLQNSSIDLKSIYKGQINIKNIDLSTNNNVAIIPNTSNNKYCQEDKVIEMYRSVICKLISNNKNIYLLFHSTQDLEMCHKIMNSVGNVDHVKLLEEELNCIEYMYLIKQFDYIIASRFHSIVNAYKVYVPCIVLGWAKKYEELLGLFKQERFNFDIRKLKDCQDDLLDSIDIMNKEFEIQSDVISGILIDIQKDSCYNFLDDVI